MDIREYTSPTLPVAQFVERYVDTDHYDAGCRGCDNYGQVWVCPPYDFSVSGYWSGFREVCLRGVQLRFSPEEQARSYHPEDLAERLRQILRTLRSEAVLPDGPADDPPAAGGVSPVGYPHRGRVPSVRALHPAGGPALPVSGGHRLYAGVFGLRRVRCGGAAAGLAASVEPEGMPAGVYGAGLRRADTVRDGLAMIAAEGKNKVRKRLVSGL